MRIIAGFLMGIALGLVILLFSKQPLPPPVILYNNAGPGWGNACVVGPDSAVTAGHVVDSIKEEDLRWVTPGVVPKVGGTVSITDRDKGRDLARVRLDGATLLPTGKIAKHRPESGDPVFVRTGQDGPVMVLRGWFMGENEDGTLAFDGLAFPGVSGSCLFNENGEVLGVVVGVRTIIDNPAVRSIVAAEALVK